MNVHIPLETVVEYGPKSSRVGVEYQVRNINKRKERKDGEKKRKEWTEIEKLHSFNYLTL